MLKKFGNLFQEKEYLKLLCAGIVTRLGDGIDTIAFSWLVYEISGSTVLMATILGVNMIPNLLFGLVSGIACQYVKEKTIMAWCDLGRFACVFLIAMLYVTQNLAIWHLFVIMFLNSTFESFRSPANNAILPQLIEAQNLENALALKESSNSLANLIGLGLGPLCVALFGFGGAIFIDALTFLLCALIVFSMKPQLLIKKDSENVSFKQMIVDMQEGFHYIKKDQLLMQIVVYGFFLNMVFVPLNIFITPFVKDYLAMGTEGVSLLSCTMVIGTILSSPLAPEVKKKLKGLTMMMGFGIGEGVIIILLSFLPLLPKPLSYVGLIAGGLMTGCCLCLLNFPFNLALYQRVDQEHLAYSGAVLGMVTQAATPMASFVFAAISGFLPINQIYLVCGFVAILFFLGMVRNPVLKQLNEV